MAQILQMSSQFPGSAGSDGTWPANAATGAQLHSKIRGFFRDEKVAGPGKKKLALALSLLLYGF